METSTEPYAGMAFASSMRGWLYERINEYVLIGAVFGGLIVSDLLLHNPLFVFFAFFVVPLICVDSSPFVGDFFLALDG